MTSADISNMISSGVVFAGLFIIFMIADFIRKRMNGGES